jgi:mRNA (2'-O-methyladenosine-N6-)-methyltransferase
LDVCRYKHYRPTTPSPEEAEQLQEERNKRSTFQLVKEKVYPPQWLDCDLRKIDVSVLGKFDVIMADPPWDSE